MAVAAEMLPGRMNAVREERAAVWASIHPSRAVVAAGAQGN